MKPIPGTLQEGGAGFQTTHWTLVLRARETQSEKSAQKALSNFCEAYWPPLYAFLRHRGHASPEAQDLVQGFFAHMLQQNTLSRADQEKGRLRTFLLGSLQNFLFNEYDRARALKRGGRTSLVNPVTPMEKSPCGSETETEPSKGNSHDREIKSS